jgi:RNA polymerase sigma factor (sigma-70 family)
MSLQRNASSFLAVIEANKGIIYKVANSYCSHEDNKKDLIQEIMIQLWLSFPKYDEQYRITTWMYRIALNVSISFYRKESRRDTINHPMPEEMLYLKEEESGGESQAAINQLYKFIRKLKKIDSCCCTWKRIVSKRLQLCWGSASPMFQPKWPVSNNNSKKNFQTYLINRPWTMLKY